MNGLSTCRIFLQQPDMKVSASSRVCNMFFSHWNLFFFSRADRRTHGLSSVPITSKRTCFCLLPIQHNWTTKYPAWAFNKQKCTGLGSTSAPTLLLIIVQLGAAPAGDRSLGVCGPPGTVLICRICWMWALGNQGRVGLQGVVWGLSISASDPSTQRPSDTLQGYCCVLMSPLRHSEGTKPKPFQG